MIYFMKPLPAREVNLADWTPFIRNRWFRNHFMYFVYCLQVVLTVSSILLGVWNFADFYAKAGLFVSVYLIHELLHLIVIWKAGDISITHSGIFFWITSGAVLSKRRFLVFMCLPFAVLTVLPAVACIFTCVQARLLGSLLAEIKYVAAYIAWVNAIIAGADIINSVLIVTKPQNSVFYRGYYRRLIDKVNSTLP